MGIYNSNNTFTNEIELNVYGNLATPVVFCKIVTYNPSSNFTIANFTVYTDARGIKGIKIVANNGNV